MGTYRLQAQSVIANLPSGGANWVVYDTHGSSNPGDWTIFSTDVADIVSQILNPVSNHLVGSQPAFGGPNTWNLQVNLDTNQIVLDGNPPIDQTDLPAGFTFTSATAHLINATIPNVAGTFAPAKIQFDALNQSSALTLPTFPVQQDFTFNRDWSLPPTFLGLFGDGIGVIIVGDSSSELIYILFESMYVDGTYTIATYTWTLDNDTQTIQLASDGVNPDLTDIEKIQFIIQDGDLLKTITVDPINFCLFTPDLLIVPIPSFCSSSAGMDVYAKINGFWVKIKSLDDIPRWTGVCP